MARAQNIVIIVGLLAGCCWGDASLPRVDTQAIDDAITAAEEAWVMGEAQTQSLKALIATADPSADSTKAAQATELGYEAQLATYDATLDTLRAQRLALGHEEAGYVVGQSINSYKSQYVGQIGALSTQLKTVEDTLNLIQTQLADTNFTDTSIVAISDARGKAIGALGRCDTALASLRSLDATINQAISNLQAQSASRADEFVTWWNQQKTWLNQTVAGLEVRRQFLTQLGDQIKQKQQTYTEAKKLQQQLSDATTDLQSKKVEAINTFKALVEVRATLIQEMSDLAGVITASLGNATDSLQTTTDKTALNDVLAVAQSITDNMVEMGDLQRSFSNSEGIVAQALASLKTYLSEQESADLTSSVTQQSAWIKSFGAALQAMRDQSSAVRTRLDALRTQFDAATSASSNQSAEEYAASVSQLSQIIIQIHNEAGGVVNNVLTPLVTGLANKSLALTNGLDVSSSSSMDRGALKLLLDETQSDCDEVDASVKEFNLWSSMLDQYGDLVQRQVTDAALRQTLAATQKDFGDWKLWVSTVVQRQESLKKTISAARDRYGALVSQPAASAQPSVVLSSSLTTTLDALSMTTTVTNAEGASLLASITTPTTIDPSTSLAMTLTTTQQVGVQAQVDGLRDTRSQPVASAQSMGGSGEGQGDAAVKAFADSLAQTVASIAALQKTAATFAVRFNRVTITSDFASVSKDFMDARSQANALSAAVAQLPAAADAAQRQLDKDVASGRVLNSATVNLLGQQRAGIQAAQASLKAVLDTLNSNTAQFNRLANSFAQQGDALNAINAAVKALAAKIQSTGANLNKLKSSIESVQGLLANGTGVNDYNTGLSRLTDASAARSSAADTKKNDIEPAYTALKTLIASYTKSYGDLPSSLASTVDSQGSWVRAVDTTLNGYVGVITTLQSQLQAKISAAQGGGASMLFADKIKALEDAVPAITNPSQANAVMQNLQVLVRNRYGSLPQDLKPATIATNKARLLRFIDWIAKNNSFSGQANALAQYRSQVAG